FVAGDLSSIRVYPNPWKAGKHDSQPIRFDQMTPNSTVKIFTVSGRHIKTLETRDSGLGTAVTWDLKNDSGDNVASGIYIYLITNDQGQKTKGKLGVVR